jgi:iron(III) transport system ATP-binding protein
MAVSVRISGVTKRFGANTVVDNVTLEIAPGELFFLLGPSGCGKTTLLRCIAGFYRPEAGTIRFSGDDITHLPPEERDTGMVFQSYALWPHMTVAENVAFGLELRKVPRAQIKSRVAEALALVKMSDRATYRPNQLSGGQQQRVALARALVIQPKCLLLDEPLSNLDAKLRLEMRAEIRRICKRAGLTALYVTHDQKEALSIADRLAIMDRGALQQVGAPQEVYLRPRNTFIAGFIGETNFVAGRIVKIGGGSVEIETGMGRMVSTVEPSEPIRPGDAVTVSLRPEIIHIGTPPPEVPNVFDGEVHDTVYLGEMAQHQVNIAGNHATLKVFELNPKIVAQDEEVKRARLWLRANNVVVLKG